MAHSRNNEMKRRKHHPRIYKANYPLLAKYDEKHPAIRALQIHAEACDICVGKEIDWPGAKEPPIEQTWFSATRQKKQFFSMFAYEFLSYSLVLDGWLELAPVPTKSEIGFLEEDQPIMRALLDECHDAADAAGNTHILPLIQKATEFMDAYNDAVIARFRECRIEWPKTKEP
jgi:hypothetical protein